MRDSVYLDYNASTPVDPGVVERMLPWMTTQFANAASTHPEGRRALHAIKTARDQIAASIGVRARNIVFTSGSTEATNLGLKGVAATSDPRRRRIVVTATEHKAVLDVAESLSGIGFEIVVVPVHTSGLLDLDALADAVTDETAIVSVIAANNETGVIAPLAEVSQIAHSAGAVLHADATQCLGRIHLDLTELDVDLASFSAHKVYGPKGVGVLAVLNRTELEPLIHGGGHENGLRSGTSNVPGIVGFGEAANLAVKRIDCDNTHYEQLVARFVTTLSASIPDLKVVGRTAPRLTNTVNVHLPGADAEAVMANAPHVAVSSGSACTSMVPAPSHVLRAMGMDPAAASECLRVSVGRPTTIEDIDMAAEDLAEAVGHVRSMGSGGMVPTTTIEDNRS